MSTKSKNNVIHFPRTDYETPNSHEEVGQKIRQYKESYSSELSEIIWEMVLGEMARAGCDLEEDAELYFPSMILIFESRSLHLMTMELTTNSKTMLKKMSMYQMDLTKQP